MGEPAYSSLPVILVSAKDNAAASYIISEIIDNDATETYKANEGDVVQDRVWRIMNKYYTADVRLHASGDEQLPGEDESVDAHIIYLQEDECAVSWCERRMCGGGDVRLVVSARGGGALAAWAARRRYELVPLARGPADSDDDDDWGPPADSDDDDDWGPPADSDDDDDWGVRRARAALHAHAWRGLARHTPAHASEPESAWSGPEGFGAVERAERFAAALAALPAARAAAHEHAHAPPHQRLARAEALLQDFCRALGLDLDDC